MAWSGLDQRAFPRLAAQCDIAIDGQMGGPIKSKTQNLGIGGVCVILDQSLEKLSHVRLRLILSRSDQPLECNGRVVWMVRSKEPASGKVSYDVGIEFLNLPAPDRDRLNQFIEKSTI